MGRIYRKPPKWRSSIFLTALLVFSLCLQTCVTQGSFRNENNPWTQILKRNIRSPFVPPMVTALDSIEKNDKKINEDIGDIPLIFQEDLLFAPIANSQSYLPKTPSPKYNRKPILENRRRLFESYNPIISNEEENSGLQLFSLRLQNDQSSTQEPIQSRQTKLRSEKYPMKKRSENTKRSMKFFDYKEVLGAVNKTNGELQKMLAKRKISFHSFIEFIENGASKEQILELLSKPVPDEEIKDDELKTLRKKKHKNSASELKINKKQLLIDLPFQEIVHEVPVDKSYEKKYYKERPKTDNNYDPDVYRPARDSPLVTHFSSSRPRQNDTLKSAAILSVSIEKPRKKEAKKISKHNLYARNKLVSGDTKPLMYADINTKISGGTDEEKELSPYQQLRLVFPVKGILIFCGVLGGFAFLTIFILIIYGSVKCSKKKPAANNYKVNDRIELTSAQCQ